MFQLTSTFTSDYKCLLRKDLFGNFFFISNKRNILVNTLLCFTSAFTDVHK